MAIGRSAPRYERIGLLYPRSKDLQSSLFEYFIVVVRLCHQMLKFTRKSTFGKLGTALNDTELSNYQTELETWAQTIKDEMNYLMAQRIEEQADFTTQLWPAKFSKSASHRRQTSAFIQALKFCSTSDHILPWKQAKKAGSTRLFDHSPDYKDWRRSDCSRTLILTGRLGSGKTVLLANIVDDLIIDEQAQKVPVALFFCRHDLPESLKPEVILGSLVGQLLRPTSDLADYVERHGFTTGNDRFKTLRDLLNCSFSTASKAYFVIDGLDECDRGDRKAVIQQLRQLQDSYKILLCATVRQEPKSPFVDDTEWTDLAETTVAAIPDNREDIEAFIEADLEARIKTGKLVTGDPVLVLEIQDALVEGSQGMFLWVVLQIEALCSMTTDEAIREALDDLPRDLSRTFARILQRSNNLSMDESHQRCILELVTAAHRPLRAEELREALSVVPGDTVWNPSKLLNNIFGILACCGSLLTLDEEEMTVRLVHSSVKQFLVESKSATAIFTFNDAQRRMTDIVVTYLNYGVFETQLSTRTTPKIQIDSAPTTVIRSTLEFSGGLRDIAVKLLKSRRKPGFDMGKTLAELRVLHPRDSQQDFRFLEYARSNCILHVLQSLGKGLQQNALLLRLLNGAILDSASSEEWNQLLFLAAEIGNEDVVKVLLHSGRVSTNAKNSDGRTPLHHAVFHAQKNMVAFLLGFPTVDAEIRDVEGWTPLNSSIICASDEICKTLIESGRVDPNAVNKSGQTPLHVAAENIGSGEMATMLLESQNIDPDRLDSIRETPLYRAVQRGNTDVARAFIESGKADCTISNSNSRTALHEAARLSNTFIVKLLMDNEHVIHNIPDGTGKTPLHEAASAGAEEIAILLIERGGGVEIDLRDENNLTPLHNASSQGAVGIVKRLIGCENVDLNAKDGMGRTPLHLAFKFRRYAVAKVLIGSKRVSIGALDNTGRIPFDHSALRDSKHVFERLLKTQLSKYSSLTEVELNWKYEDGQNLLQRVIASRPHPETLHLLLEIFDADPESRDNNWQTPLHTAAIYEPGVPSLPGWDQYQTDMYETNIEVLLDSGKFDVALDLTDENGFTPLDLAEVYANELAVWALQSSESVLRARKRIQERQRSSS